MKFPKKHILTFLFFAFVSAHCFSQEVAFYAMDSLHSYHIVTLKDGTVLKGRIIKQEKKRIDFQDELVGNVSFRAKEVASMEKVEPQDFYLITLMNGTSLQGKIINRKEKEIDVETTTLGTVTVDLSKIKNIKAIIPSNFKDGKYWFTTHIDAHYVFTPSAIPLHPGEAFFQNTLGAFNSFNVGITKNFSCFGGLVIPAAAFIAPTLNFKITNAVHAGLGIFAFDISYKPYGSAAFAQITFGNRNANLTLGGAYGFIAGIQRYYYSSRVEKIEMGLLSVSAMKRLTPKYAIVTENWFTPTEGISAFTGCFRWMGEKNSFDFGVAAVSISARIAGKRNDIVTAIPFISFMRNL